MRRGKTVTPQILIGEQGIALIESRCLEMGYLFHPRRVDHGIDGHIDLVDPTSRTLLNLLLLVQSKAQNRPFASETADEFHYICDQRDLDLWLAGNAPVLLVFSHPSSNEAWWIEVKSAFPDAASRATRAVYVNKHSQVFDRTAAPALIRLAQPKHVGMYLRPPPIVETLTTNLMPVVEVPRTIWSAPAAANDYPAAGALLADAGHRAGGWILRDTRVFSFGDLRQQPLSLLCAGPIQEFGTSEWADSEDTDIQYWFMDLLSHTLDEAYPELRWHKRRRHLHFRPTRNLTPRKAGKGPGVRGRTVFGPHFAKSDPTRVSYYHHAALRYRFRRLDGEWYCQLEPDYCFTSDGVAESRFADSLLSGIKRLERHAAVAGWIRAWANYLDRHPDLFSQINPIRLGRPASVKVDRGIDDRWWGPAPSGAMPEGDLEDSQADDALAEAALASADIDTADLLTLLEEPKQKESLPHRSRRRSRRRGRDKVRGGSSPRTEE
jgi:hypothetical protein